MPKRKAPTLLDSEKKLQKFSKQLDNYSEKYQAFESKISVANGVIKLNEWKTIHFRSLTTVLISFLNKNAENKILVFDQCKLKSKIALNSLNNILQKSFYVKSININGYDLGKKLGNIIKNSLSKNNSIVNIYIQTCDTTYSDLKDLRSEMEELLLNNRFIISLTTDNWLIQQVHHVLLSNNQCQIKNLAKELIINFHINISPNKNFNKNLLFLYQKTNKVILDYEIREILTPETNSNAESAYSALRYTLDKNTFDYDVIKQVMPHNIFEKVDQFIAEHYQSLKRIQQAKELYIPKNAASGETIMIPSYVISKIFSYLGEDSLWTREITAKPRDQIDCSKMELLTPMKEISEIPCQDNLEILGDAL